MAATVDVLSEGRLQLGIGAGWKDLKYKAYCYRFPLFRERVDRMSEAIEVILRMWTEERASFKARYYAIQDTICDPKRSRGRGHQSGLAGVGTSSFESRPGLPMVSTSPSCIPTASGPG